LIGRGISLCGDGVWHSALWPPQHREYRFSIIIKPGCLYLIVLWA
jgi:hypothetical protein